MLQGPLLSHQAVGPLTHLMAAVVLSQASLGAFHALSHFIFIPAPKVRMTVIPISQMQKPSFRQAKYLARGHTLPCIPGVVSNELLLH